MQFVADLMRTWSKILRRGRPGHRLQLLSSYTKLRLAFLPVKLGRSPAWSANRPGRMKLLGYSVELPAFYPCVMLFEELFIDEAYAVDALEAPRILDCGAHVGLATLYFTWRWPDPRIAAFEPDPERFRLLERNVTANGLANVELHNAALTASGEPVDFHTQNDYQGGTANSIHMTNFHSGVPVRSITVPGVPLSTFLQSPADLVKLDIEGAEDEVIEELHAAGRLSAIRQLVLEYHARSHDGLGRVLDRLERAGMDVRVETEANETRGTSAAGTLMVRARQQATFSGPAPDVTTTA